MKGGGVMSLTRKGDSVKMLRQMVILSSKSRSS